jgi:DNA-binding NarL/FixJ family response regulator
LKTTNQDTLVTAIESVHSGATFIEPLLKNKIEAASPADHRRVYSKLSLTIREKEILRLLVAGHENHKIAEQLHLGYNTVRNYRARIFDKLEVNSISELISKALTQGLVE